MSNERIQLSDSTIEMVMKMSGGNPGAVRVLAEMLREGERIDPDSFYGGFGSILTLDSNGIYEDKIWMLYKDLCYQDVTATIGLLRGIQLGIISAHEVKKALDQPYAELPQGRVEEVLAAVRERLSGFAK